MSRAKEKQGSPLATKAKSTWTFQAAEISPEDIVKPVRRAFSNPTLTSSTWEPQEGWGPRKKADLETPSIDWQSSIVNWCDGSAYRRTSILGYGASSIVYAALHRSGRKSYALKAIRAGCSGKVKREIFMLNKLRGGPNIIQFHGAFIDGMSSLPIMVFDNVSITNWAAMEGKLTPEDRCFYSYQLCKALEFAHSKDIIHRDVKPENILINTKTRELHLIDWGLAESYVPEGSYKLQIGTGVYRPPEVLLGNRQYDCSFDMWSFGCIMAAVLFEVNVFFCGEGNVEQLRRIVDILGGADLRKYLNKHDFSLATGMQEVVELSRTKRTQLGPLCQFSAYSGNLLLVDLVEKLLRYDPAERMTASQALAHPYLNTLANSLESQATCSDGKWVRDIPLPAEC
ncbi:kinase-like domain-containing protein [Fimicolochytrium jonesii]|uniref:kinase-like domain-containing protein n=1 Tax=Fimicolochytrium jonesii TaxID=1396493 RepID=UPI0022FEF930|nr:kinase-like domain-containing protein [Fimicolochytrium jonesii]KAI8825814.1 kinase-like domain-containing protein [Fimicolochytrium jonesii]